MFHLTACVTESAQGAGAGGMLILGEGSCPPVEYAGKAQCVYLDPPFNTGDRYGVRLKDGEGNPLSAVAYADRFESREAYHDLLRGLILGARELLKEDGTFFLHLDQRETAWGRLLCDEAFGADHFVNEIIWAYQSGGRTRKRFSPKHDNILFYRKGKTMFFDITGAPLSRQENRKNHMKREVDETGRTYRTIRSGGKVYTYYDDEPVYPGDVWTDISHIQQKDPQRTGFATQKPLALLQRIIRTASRPGDLVADLCCGSGTTLMAAAEDGRTFLGMDKSPVALAVTRQRLHRFALETRWTRGQEPPGVEADLVREETCDRVRLREKTAGGETGIRYWAAGVLREGRFLAQAHAVPVRGTGEMRRELKIPPGQEGVALLVTDLWGRTGVWTWEEGPGD